MLCCLFFVAATYLALAVWCNVILVEGVRYTSNDRDTSDDEPYDSDASDSGVESDVAQHDVAQPTVDTAAEPLVLDESTRQCRCRCRCAQPDDDLTH